MEKSLNPNPSYYLILKPCLWFHVDEKVSVDRFKEYYTPKAIKTLIEYQYIKIILN